MPRTSTRVFRQDLRRDLAGLGSVSIMRFAGCRDRVFAASDDSLFEIRIYRDDPEVERIGPLNSSRLAVAGGRLWTLAEGGPVIDPRLNDLPPGRSRPVWWIESERAWRIDGTGSVESVPVPTGAIDAVETDDGTVWWSTRSGLIAGDTGIETPLPFEGEIRALDLDSHGHVWAATSSGVGIHRAGFWEWIDPQEGLPFRDVQGIRLGSEGALWVRFHRGAARFWNGEWRFFAGRRWLPSDSVRGIEPDDDGGAFVGTSAGAVWIRAHPFTLRAKAVVMQAQVAGQNRNGFVAPCRLESPGDIESRIPEASDNDGLWTALYVASQALRYRVTGEPAALAEVDRSFAALERLESVTPIDGFPARALVDADERVARSDPETGEWHESEDGRRLWKGDTSSDELDGHFFACAVVWDEVDDRSLCERAARHAGRMADHLIRNDFNLIDLDGQHTRWGFFSPSILNSPAGKSQRGLNSLEILSHLRVAARLTGDERYESAYRRLAEEHGYALNVVRQKRTEAGHVNHSDDELAFLAFYPLVRYESDPDLARLYRWAFRRSWEIERPERSPFLNFLYGATTGDRCDADTSMQSLEEMPLDLIHWSTLNSDREDLARDPETGRFGEPQSRRALSPAERGMLKWNGNPYRLDTAGGGHEMEDGTCYLLPYWLGRATGWIAPDTEEGKGTGSSR